ncbi:MAG TPA: ABC transporter ATP-binding protein [Chitinophagaceae bacterium]|nr:ABC transporter ATP-binding protein [Chitinophagaceae bacterium]
MVFPTSGVVTVFGEDPGKRSPKLLQDIFFVPEEIDTPDANIISFAKSLSIFYPKFDLGQYKQLLDHLNVPNSNFKHLSFGQKKKTWIALGIASNTGLLIFDEPTNVLDIPSKQQFRKILAEHVDDERCLVISTHQVKDLENLIDNIIILDDGHILVNASVDTIAEELSFKRFTDKADLPVHIYSESNLFGAVAVIKSQPGEYNSHVDIELFFNATIANKLLMKDIFNSKPCI